jgi:hypothetical protein
MNIKADPNVPPLPPHITLKDAKNFMTMMRDEPELASVIKNSANRCWRRSCPARTEPMVPASAECRPARSAARAAAPIGDAPEPKHSPNRDRHRRAPQPSGRHDRGSVLIDSAMEHYRGNFHNKAMWTPIVTSSLSIAVSATACPIGGTAPIGCATWSMRSRAGDRAHRHRISHLQRHQEGRRLQLAEPLLFRARSARRRRCRCRA